ncbi:MAG: ATP-grasp domain-containing protein [Gammaproteobacteria bacterium]|nr:ATP-grasp domain-containing protein [Gammaproteobacteria bacterium]
MKIAVVRNRNNRGVVSRFGRPSPEVYGRKSVQRVMDALRAYGHEVRALEGDGSLVSKLKQFIPPLQDGQPGGLAFNMAYGIQGECRYTHVPAVLEMAGVPYTGSAPLGHALSLDKVIAKQLLVQTGVPTPAFCVLNDPRENAEGLRYPLIVKPRHESTSYGVRIVHDRQALADAVQYIVTEYRQQALVEEYIDGREVNIGILGNHPVEVFAPVELDFGDRECRIETWEDKFHKTSDEPQKRCPAPVEDNLVLELQRIARATFKATHCRDYARIDVRVDAQGRPFVLEINSMASLGAGGSYVLAAQDRGYGFDALVNRIVDVAHARYFDGADPLAASSEPISPFNETALSPCAA